MDLEELLQQARKNEQAGLLEEAILSYEKALTLEPENKEAILGISRLYLMLGSSFRSLETLLQAKTHSSDVDYLVQKANTYMTLNQFQDAEKELKKALKIKTSAPVMNNLGVVLIRLGKPEEALHYFLESIKLDDMNPNTWFNLSTYYETQHNLEKAIETIRQGIQKKAVPELQERLIQLLSKQGKHNEAILKAEEALTQYPDHIIVNIAYLRALFHASEWVLLLNSAKEFRGDKILEAQIEKELTEMEEQSHFHLKEFASSLELIDQLIAQYPTQTGYLIRKAYVLAVSRQFASSLSVIKQVLTQPNVPPAIRTEAFLLMKNIEIENWKELVKALLFDPSFNQELINNPNQILQGKGILLPEEGIAFIKQLIQKQNHPFDGIDFNEGMAN